MPRMLFRGLEHSAVWICGSCKAEGRTSAAGEVAHECDRPNVVSIKNGTAASMHPPAEANLMPPSQGKRDAIRPRYDLIPQQWMEAIARIFEEGRKSRPGLLEGYGDSWKAGGKEFLQDCLNHAQHHLLLYNQGDRSEEHLAKVAWNVLAVNYHSKLKGEGDGSR